MSNAANLGFAFRSPLVPPNAFMLVENLHQRKSVEASCAPQPSPRFALWACLLVARKVRFVFWLGRGCCRLLDSCWARLALSLTFSLTLVADAERSGRELICSFPQSTSTFTFRHFRGTSLCFVLIWPLPLYTVVGWRLLLRSRSRRVRGARRRRRRRRIGVCVGAAKMTFADFSLSRPPRADNGQPRLFLVLAALQNGTLLRF